MTSSNTSIHLLKKIALRQRKKSFKVAILGENGVGKSAFTVRFITRRYIGEYDPFLEKTYSCSKQVHGSNVDFEILDTAIQHENNCMEANIRWADAFVLMYSVTDRCSFNECCRLKFLINSYCKKRRPLRMISDPQSKVIFNTVPVILVGNQMDKVQDRIVSLDEGRRRAFEMGCFGFYEISVSEMIDEISEIFEDLYTMYKSPSCSKLRKSKSFIFIDRESREDSEGEDHTSDVLTTNKFNPARRIGI